MQTECGGVLGTGSLPEDLSDRLERDVCTKVLLAISEQEYRCVCAYLCASAYSGGSWLRSGRMAGQFGARGRVSLGWRQAARKSLLAPSKALIRAGGGKDRVPPICPCLRKALQKHQMSRHPKENGSGESGSCSTSVTPPSLGTPGCKHLDYAELFLHDTSLLRSKCN